MRYERAAIPFDQEYFKKRTHLGIRQTTKEKFEHIYDINLWAGESSLSGMGSDQIQTKRIAERLPELVKKYQISTFLDMPCGDFNWMKNVVLEVERYVGADIVPAVVEKNKIKYGNKQRTFIEHDLINSRFSQFDLIFCRDCLVHFSFEDIKKSVLNIKKSGSQYLLTTTFTECKNNTDIVTGDWRIINLQKPPFNFPKPLEIINEGCSEGEGTYDDKSMGLWCIEELDI
jgi:hypothetical protein